ncbi:uncharacterized protein LOC118201228 [Stegodyphus dumicola]|uniref:uncharacterized protein LOC118201228 n=1 Tax=Stegodyphus dumicola TaxID=202533 RepID=UPI0015ACFF9F|nr:uncharacterized protein LOC118201228 [Stegodyphus dumicola]
MVTYAAAIWAEPMQGRKVRHLQSLQRQFALQITRAFRTTSSSALNVMAGLIPLTSTYSAGSSNTIRQVLQGTGLRIFLKDVTLPPIPSIQYFTDGSKIDQQIGCALVAFHNGLSIYQWLGHLHGNNSVFQAEALAVLKAVQHCKTSGAMEAIIITDSLSSLQAIQNPRHSSSLISDIQCELRNQVGNNITLAWTKGHVGDHGNTLADNLAKSAAENTDAEAEEVILKWPTSHLKRALLLKVIS